MDKSVKELTILAKEGDLRAKNKLFERNIDAIIKFANTAYFEIIKVYDVEKGTKIPDNLISKDDVVQDFLIKSNELFDIFLKHTNYIFFSTYLSKNLSPYVKTYSRRKINQIKEVNDMECYRNLDNCFYAYLECVNEEKLKKYIFDMVDNNKTLKNHREFIELVLSGYSYDELERLMNLEKRELKLKLFYICKLLKKHEKNFLVSKQIEELIEQARSGNSKAVEMIVDNYSNYILEYVNITYERIKNLDCKDNEFLQEEIIGYFDLKLRYYINKYIDNEYKESLEKYLNRFLYICSKQYVKNKINSLKKVNSNDNILINNDVKIKIK